MKYLITCYLKVLTCKLNVYDVINHVLSCQVDIDNSYSINVKEVQSSKKCVFLYCNSILNHCPVCEEKGKSNNIKINDLKKTLKS